VAKEGHQAPIGSRVSVPHNFSRHDEQQGLEYGVRYGVRIAQPFIVVSIIVVLNNNSNHPNNNESRIRPTNTIRVLHNHNNIRTQNNSWARISSTYNLSSS
jgi:hypothetical protein